MKNKKKSIIFIILRIIGIALILFGISRVIIANNMYIPDMGAPNWFEKSAEQSRMLFSGIACCMFGIFTTIISFIPAIDKASTKMLINRNTEIANSIKEIMDTTASTVDTQNDTEPKKRYCEYCGCELQSNSTKCKHCGHGK